jgi:ribosomal protein S27AE
MTALIRIDRSFTVEGDGRPRPIRFCSRCGHPSDEPPHRPDLRGRVCERCGMGLMLTCSRDALPGDAAAFLIATFDLTVSAVSEAGERIFGPEQTLMGKPLLDVISSPLGDDHFGTHVGRAAQRACDAVVMPVRLRGAEESRRVGTMAARIATCGPPRAALVTVEPSEFGRH